jgi:hypothetical protein
MFTAQKFKEKLEQSLEGRPYILRTDPIRKQLDGLSAGVLANMDSTGTGPEGLFYVGRKVAYEKTAYINWLVTRITQGRGVD